MFRYIECLRMNRKMRCNFCEYTEEEKKENNFFFAQFVHLQQKHCQQNRKPMPQWNSSFLISLLQTLQRHNTDNDGSETIAAFISYANFIITQQIFLKNPNQSYCAVDSFKLIWVKMKCILCTNNDRFCPAFWCNGSGLNSKITHFNISVQNQNYTYLFPIELFLQWNFASIAIHLGLDLSICDIRERRAFSISSVCIGTSSIVRCTKFDKRFIWKITAMLLQMVYGGSEVFKFRGLSRTRIVHKSQLPMSFFF